MNKIYSEENQKIVDNLQQIIYNYDENFIKIAKTFVPEYEMHSKLLSDQYRLEMLKAIQDIMLHLPFVYETKLN